MRERKSERVRERASVASNADRDFSCLFRAHTSHVYMCNARILDNACVRKFLLFGIC